MKKTIKRIVAVIVCLLMLLSLCSCTEIYIEILYDRPPAREVIVTLPPETETEAQNVNTGEPAETETSERQ